MRADICDGSLRRFLHNVAERAGQLELSGTGNGYRLDVQQIAADLGICKAVYLADVVIVANSFGQQLARSEIFCDILCLYADAAELLAAALSLDNALCGLAAERGYLTLERADTRLCGVKVDKLGNGGIVYSQLLCRKTRAASG